MAAICRQEQIYTDEEAYESDNIPSDKDSDEDFVPTSYKKKPQKKSQPRVAKAKNKEVKVKKERKSVKRKVPGPKKGTKKQNVINTEQAIKTEEIDSECKSTVEGDPYNSACFANSVQEDAIDNKDSIEVKKERKGVKRKSAGPSKAVKKQKVIKTEETVSEGANIVEAYTCGSSSTIDPVQEHDIDYKNFKIEEIPESWNAEEVVAETTNVPIHVARNVIKLLEEECTIPFIVRYRKSMTGSLQADKVREIQTSYEEVKQVHKKVAYILKTVKHEKFDANAAAALRCAKTMDEVELMYAPFKPGSKRTLAERSKQLGLEPIALQLLESKTSLNKANISSFIKPQKGLETEEEILTGIQHIIADAISKDRRVLDYIRQMSQQDGIRILSSKSASAEKEDKRAHVEGKTTENFKYENYFNLNIPLKFVAPHQVMAVNRGEKQKVLKVKIGISFTIQKMVKNFIWDTFFRKTYFDPETLKFLRNCVDDSYERLLEPHMCRQIRSELTKKAEKESIAVFCSNVKSLLLTPPVRGKVVVGIDPGFSHGCKVAKVSSKGEVLHTDVIYPHSKGKNKSNFDDVEKLKHMISTDNTEIIAIGNGTACRETEMWLSDLIKSRCFHPFEIKYCIVNESGVSIYSVTKDAESEFPGMDPNIRSAVSIARRLQDPLLEYVKVEPKHLGVGMYQHDVPEAQLKKALDGIVEECVSFVGVDLNVCSEILLRKLSGLSASRAKQIVEWRTKNGAFINRQQLLEVKGLGQKSFEQCAGFVKILPETSVAVPGSSSDAQGQRKKGKKAAPLTPNPLDKTIIHPESYIVAERFLAELKADGSEIGTQSFVDKVNSYMKFTSTEAVAKTFDVPFSVMQLIIDAFKQLQDYDIRGEFEQPLFLTSVRTFSDLKVNQELTGRVTNVTGFGAFVDCGVGRDGLIHVSEMKGQKVNVGNRITVQVKHVDFDRKRLQLKLSTK